MTRRAAPGNGSCKAGLRPGFLKNHIPFDIAGRKRLRETRIPKARHTMYRRMVLTTAWQESCFRQFVLGNDDITYLRSYNQTSVGIMQINERVWRGIYDLQKLRWDIAYNAMTGCEILELYFNRYAMPWMNRQPDRDWDDGFLAGMLYAMYSGGPGHLENMFTAAPRPAAVT